MPTEEDGYEPRTHRVGDGRRSGDAKTLMNWQAISVILALSINFFALVWGAATMNSGLKSLETAVAEVKVVGQQLSQQVSRLSERQAVLESRVEDLRDQGSIR